MKVEEKQVWLLSGCVVVIGFLLVLMPIFYIEIALYHVLNIHTLGQKAAFVLLSLLLVPVLFMSWVENVFTLK